MQQAARHGIAAATANDKIEADIQLAGVKPMSCPKDVHADAHQDTYPGLMSWWASAWSSFGHDMGFTPASWMSASILSFCAAGIMTLLVRGATRLLQQ